MSATKFLQREIRNPENVSEAKLVCDNGFCISLESEWIENPSGEYDKQDGESEAFVRLSEKKRRKT